MENLQKSVRVLAIFVITCVLTIVSRNTFAVDAEGRVPAASEVTADNQAMNASDMEISRKIRKQIMESKNLSLNAQNVKIISQNGKVTLKGRVMTPQEKTTIGEMAENVVGQSNVVNDTTVVKR
jgi:osmotically-inducible protein OsmY